MTRVYGIRKGGQWWNDHYRLFGFWSHSERQVMPFGSIGKARDYATSRNLGEVEIVEI